MKDYSAIVNETIEKMKRNQVISSYLLVAGQITNEKLQQHAKYVNLAQGEKPLFLVDVRVPIWGRLTGLLVTDRNVYYRCMKITTLFRGLTMIFSGKKTGKVALDSLNEISLGDWVMGSGTDTSYLGHRLSINGNVIGTLMLGKYTFDEKLIENLDTLFKALV